jgi:hypothetical protein
MKKIQYFAYYSGGDPDQEYSVSYAGLLSRGVYVRHRGDEARALYRYQNSDGDRTYDYLKKDGTWEFSDRVMRYVWLGSSDTMEEIEYEEAKRIATLFGFPEVVEKSEDAE